MCRAGSAVERAILRHHPLDAATTQAVPPAEGEAAQAAAPEGEAAPEAEHAAPEGVQEAGGEAESSPAAKVRRVGAGLRSPSASVDRPEVAPPPSPAASSSSAPKPKPKGKRGGLGALQAIMRK